MDPYEDAIKAFDDLIDLLGQSPAGIATTVNGQPATILRRPGEYEGELAERAWLLANALHHLILEGLFIEETYVWRKFGEVSGALRNTDPMLLRLHSTPETLREWLRVVKAAKEDLTDVYARWKVTEAEPTAPARRRPRRS